MQPPRFGMADAQAEKGRLRCRASPLRQAQGEFSLDSRRRLSRLEHTEQYVETAVSGCLPRAARLLHKTASRLS